MVPTPLPASMHGSHNPPLLLIGALMMSRCTRGRASFVWLRQDLRRQRPFPCVGLRQIGALRSSSSCLARARTTVGYGRSSRSVYTRQSSSLMRPTKSTAVVSCRSTSSWMHVDWVRLRG